jgi:D-3-phosphoglycerate dehydrogenase / 2-oxoglutarate reductase
MRILVSPSLNVPDFESTTRTEGLASLEQFGDVEFYPGDLTVEEAEGVRGVIANSKPIHTAFYEQAKDLRIIARWGVGFENVNQPAANKAGVIITTSPVHMSTVAEYAIAQWMATLKRTYTLNHMSHGGDFSLIRTFDAEGSTLGLYGFGRIGQQMARRAKPLLGDSGRLLVYDIRPDIADLAAEYGAEAVDDPAILFEQCDAVSLHVAGDETVVTYDQLQRMQPHASLINPSRGNLVNDDDVNRAIREEKLYYYVVDDPVNDSRAIHEGNPRIICTNHNGGITTASVARLDACCVKQVTDAIEGRQPEHILNPTVLDHPRVKDFLGL